MALLQRLKPLCTLSIPDDNPDIESYIDGELKRLVGNGRLVLGDPNLVLEIHDALSQGAQGMFLWVALQIGSLCFERTDVAIRKALLNLPKTLSETFSRILQRSSKLGEDYQFRILQIIIAARRPLSTVELREALGVIPGDTVWNPGMQINDINAVLGCCGSILTVDEEDLAVRLIHHSVEQFIYSDYKDPVGNYLTAQTADKFIADIVITYLNYGIFDTKVSTTAIPPMMTGAVLTTVLNSTLNFSSTAQNLALKLLKARKSTNQDMRATLAGAGASRLATSTTDYYFYDYAKNFFFEHACSYILDFTPRKFKLLLNTVENANFELGLALEEPQKPISWGSKEGRTLLLKLLLEPGRDPNQLDGEEQAPLSWAAENGHLELVRHITQRETTVIDIFDRNCRTPLCVALKNEHEEIAQELLSKGASLDSRDDDGCTSYFRAIKDNDPVLVHRLIRRGADVYRPDNKGRSPIWWAIEKKRYQILVVFMDQLNIDQTLNRNPSPLDLIVQAGDAALLEKVLKEGVDPNVKDSDGNTAILVAVQSGWGAAVDILLSYGAKINFRNKIGCNPLWWAMSLFNKQMTTKLLEKGADLEYPSPRGNCYNSDAFIFKSVKPAHIQVLFEDSEHLHTNLRWELLLLSLCLSDRRADLVKKLLATQIGLDIGMTDRLKFASIWLLASHSEIKMVRSLLQKVVDLDFRDNTRRVPLSIAAEGGYDYIVGCLIEQGANPNLINEESEVGALNKALKRKDKTIIEKLLRAGARANPWEQQELLRFINRVDLGSWFYLPAEQDLSSTFWSILLRAVDENDPITVKSVLRRERSVRFCNEALRSPAVLSQAVIKGHIEIIKVLLDHGADANMRDPNSGGWTPLIWALAEGQNLTAIFLLDQGADFRLPATDGTIPLSLLGPEIMKKVGSIDSPNWSAALLSEILSRQIPRHLLVAKLDKVSAVNKHEPNTDA